MTFKRHCALWLVCVLVFAPAFAAGKKMTIEDSLAVKTVGDLEWSPDGKEIIFTVTEVDREENQNVTHVYKVPRDQGATVQLTRGKKGESSPKLSPDGQYIGFLANRDEKNQIYILPLAGGEARQLTEEDTGVTAFSWSPDSRSMAFTSADPREDKKEREEKKKKKFDAVVVDADLNWTHLWKIDVAGKEKKRLSSGDFNVTDVRWSPDGKSIVFVTNYLANQESSWKHIDDNQQGHLFLVSAEGGESKNLTSDLGRASGPRWSPSGDRLAFSGSKGVTSGDKVDLRILNVKTGNIQNLTDADPNPVQGAEWSKDGKSLYYSQGLGVYTQLFRIPAAGGKAVQLTSKQGLGGAFELSPDGKTLAFEKNIVDAGDDVWVRNLDGDQEVRLTDINPQVREFDLAETRPLRWQSDGYEIEGVLTLPLDYQEGRRYPMILSIHGGPTGRSGHSFNTRNQIFAANGYAILQPNPRGSTGYGNDFAKANYMDWGGKDFHDDDMSGVDKVIQMGIADPEKLVVMGGSYGGFSTFWAITQTDRFKAAIGHAAISDWYSFFGQTDIPMYLHWGFGGSPWETRATYEKFSPYNYVQNVKTPLMITHGEKDSRVPIAQAEQYYTALKKLGVDVVFVRYPREGHGIREPNHVIDLVGRQLAWFDKHLGIDRPERKGEPVVSNQ